MTNSKHTILIIEDNLLNLRMLSLRLEKRNFNIIEQADGNSVILLLEQFLPDLILMDMNLPGISGWDLSGKIKSNPRTRVIPIIAVTASAMPGDREQALQAGCDDYITKPVDFQSLLGIIECQLQYKAAKASLPDILACPLWAKAVFVAEPALSFRD